MAKRANKKPDELRTQEFNLLMCKMRLSEDSNLYFDFRKDGREGSIPVEELVEAVNNYYEGQNVNTKLNIVTI